MPQYVISQQAQPNKLDALVGIGVILLAFSVVQLIGLPPPP
jgi:hypothetical protein